MKPWRSSLSVLVFLASLGALFFVVFRRAEKSEIATEPEGRSPSASPSGEAPRGRPLSWTVASEPVTTIGPAADLCYEIRVSGVEYEFSRGARGEEAPVDRRFETRFKAEPARERSEIEVIDFDIRENFKGGEPTFLGKVEGARVFFDLDDRGRVAGFSIEPELPRQASSMVRSLVRLHVPAILPPEGESHGSFDLDLDDSLLGLVLSTPAPSEMDAEPEPSSARVVSNWRKLPAVVPGPAGETDWTLLDLEHFEAAALDAWGASRIYTGAFLLDPEGHVLAGCAFYGEMTRSVHIDHLAVEIRAWIVREGLDAAEVRPLLEERVEEGRRRLFERLPGRDAPSILDEMPEDGEPADPADRFVIPVETATVPDILGVLEAVWSGKHDRKFLKVLRELARRAAEDPAVVDRLFQIVEEGGDLALRKTAVIALGFTELREVRLKLFDLAEADGEDLGLRELALRSVFGRRDSGVVAIGEDRLEPSIDPVTDSILLDRTLRASERTDLPVGVVRVALGGLSATQRASPEARDNAASRQLRKVFESRDDPEIRRQIVGSLGGFPSKENFGFLADLYRRERGTPLASHIASHLTTVGMRDPSLAEPLYRMQFELAEEAASRKDLGLFLGNIPHTGATNERLLTLAREGILKPLGSGENAQEAWNTRRSLICSLSGFGSDLECAPKARAILVELSPHFEGDAELSDLIEKSIAYVDRISEKMRRIREGG